MAMAVAAGLLHALLLFRAGMIDIGAVVAYFGLLMMLDFPDLCLAVGVLAHFPRAGRCKTHP